MLDNTNNTIFMIQGGGPGTLRKATYSIMSILTMSPKTFLNWKTSNLNRKNY